MMKSMLWRCCLLNLAIQAGAYPGIVGISHTTTVYSVSDSDLLQASGVIVDAAELRINEPESAGRGVSTLIDGVFPDDDRALAVAGGR